MAYRLGVDLGTTFTAAAVDDGTGPDDAGPGQPGAVTVPSVVYLDPDGHFLFGEAADRRASDDASPGRPRVQAEDRRHRPDPGRRPALLPAGTVGPAPGVGGRGRHRAAGRPPDQVVVTHPANWGGYKRELLRQLITLADVPDAATCTEPEAAATQYASHARARRRRQGRRLRPRRWHVRRVRPGEAGRRGSRSWARRTASSTSAGSTSTRPCSSTSSAMLAEPAVRPGPRRPSATVRGLARLPTGVRRGQGGALQRRRHRDHRRAPRGLDLAAADPPGARGADRRAAAGHPGRHGAGAALGRGCGRPTSPTVVLVGGSSRIPLVSHLLQQRVRRPHRDGHPPQARHRPRRGPPPQPRPAPGARPHRRRCGRRRARPTAPEASAPPPVGSEPVHVRGPAPRGVSMTIAVRAIAPRRRRARGPRAHGRRDRALLAPPWTEVGCRGGHPRGGWPSLCWWRASPPWRDRTTAGIRAIGDESNPPADARRRASTPTADTVLSRSSVIVSHAARRGTTSTCS